MTISTRLAREATRAFLLLAVAFGVLPEAGAQNVSIPFKATYKGTVEMRGYAYNYGAGSGDCGASIYTVPAGMTLRITDYLVSPYYVNGAPIAQNYLCTGTTSCDQARTIRFVLAPNSVVTYNSTTGLKVDAGNQVFVCQVGSDNYVGWQITGFLYTSP